MIKNEKGSVTLIVVVTVLFILLILSASLMFVSTKRQAQLQESMILQNVYGGGDLYDVYDEQVEKRQYKLTEGIVLKNSLTKGPVTLENIGASSAGFINKYTIDEQNGLYINDASETEGHWLVYDFVASDGYSTSLILNHIYYASIDVKLTNGKFLFTFSNRHHKDNKKDGLTAVGKTFSTITSTHSKISLYSKPIAVGNSTYESDYFDCLQWGSSMVDISTFYVRNLIILDLTAIFGEGNEPTQDWCDKNINFDSTVVFK